MMESVQHDTVDQLRSKRKSKSRESTVNMSYDYSECSDFGRENCDASYVIPSRGALSDGTNRISVVFSQIVNLREVFTGIRRVSRQ